MLASSCLVLTALTVTGLYVRNLGKEEEQEENVVDFTALEDEEESLTMLRSQTGEQEEGQAVEDVGVPSEAALDEAAPDGQAVEDGNSAQNQAGEGADGADPGADNAAAGEAALTDEARLDGAQQDYLPQDNLPQEEEALAEAEEEALAANASDAIAKSEQAGEEDADAMSASTLLDFTDSDTLVWPIVGNVLVNYSMDKTVYFATLDQYKYSPAIVIAATEGEEITAAADGQVTDVYQDPETGTTVVMNLGDGYELTYGQLTDLAVAEGDMVVTGDPVGKVAAPTMYYSVEGTNVYFKLTKDGVPVYSQLRVETTGLLQAGKGKVSLDTPGRGRVFLDEHRLPGSPAQSLDSHLSASREEIQEPALIDLRLQHVKERLLDPVRGGTGLHSLYRLQRHPFAAAPYHSHRLCSFAIHSSRRARALSAAWVRTRVRSPENTWRSTCVPAA